MDIEAHKRLFFYSKGYRGEMVVITSINIIVSLISIFMALVTKEVIDYAVNGVQDKALTYGIYFAILLMLDISFSNYVSYRTVRVTESIRNRLQIEALESIYNKSYLEINKFKTGDLLTRLYNDIGNIVTVYIATIPSLIALILRLFLAFAFLCYYDVVLAMLTFLITPLAILISMLIGRKLKSVQHKIQQIDGVKRSLITESLQNIIILKTFNFIQSNILQIAMLQKEKYELIKKKNFISIKANIMIGLGYQLGFFGAIGLGAYRLMNKTIGFGTFTAFLQLVGQIQGPIFGLSKSLPLLIASLSSVERIDEMYKLANETHINIANEIHLAKNVHFSYSSQHSVIKDLSFRITRGEKVAIIGPSGEGKTTFIHLLLALISPQEGDMKIVLTDSKCIDIDVKTREYFTYVPQNSSLFSGSIISNFLLTGKQELSEIDLALKVSCSLEFINELPDKLETVLGERGIGLSQGQTQRLSIARALLHKAPFLIFDEATSALDLETEKKLLYNIKDYYPEISLIAVTHRESVFEICDKVYQMKGGLFYEV